MPHKKVTNRKQKSKAKKPSSQTFFDTHLTGWPPSVSVTMTATEALKKACDYYAGCGMAPKDDALSAFWFKVAAEKGNVEAMRRLGDCYALGYGVSKSQAEAFRWYTKAKEQGDEEGAKKLEELKSAFKQSSGGTCNDGARDDYSPRQVNMAFPSNRTVVAVKTPVTSLRGDVNQKASSTLSEAASSLPSPLYRPSRAALVHDAIYYLVCYAYGTPTKANRVKHYFDIVKSAAEEGDVEAMLTLADCYKRGFGVSENTAEAVRWYTKVKEHEDKVKVSEQKRACK